MPCAGTARRWAAAASQAHVCPAAPRHICTQPTSYYRDSHAAPAPETRTRLLIDPHSGLVVRHEDEWQNVPTLHLPLAWRRLNGLCMGLMWRMLGWQRELAEAERRCAAAWE